MSEEGQLDVWGCNECTAIIFLLTSSGIKGGVCPIPECAGKIEQCNGTARTAKAGHLFRKHGVEPFHGLVMQFKATEMMN